MCFSTSIIGHVSYCDYYGHWSQLDLRWFPQRLQNKRRRCWRLEIPSMNRFCWDSGPYVFLQHHSTLFLHCLLQSFLGTDTNWLAWMVRQWYCWWLGNPPLAVQVESKKSMLIHYHGNQKPIIFKGFFPIFWGRKTLFFFFVPKVGGFPSFLYVHLMESNLGNP